VAVTRTIAKAVHRRTLASRWLIAASLVALTAGPAIAQNGPALPVGPVQQTPLQAPQAATPQAASPQAAGPQTAAPQPASAPSAGLTLPPQPPPPQLAGPPTDKRGFLNDFKNWWDKSVADFNAKVKEQNSKLDAFNKTSNQAAQDAAAATQQAMKDAAQAMVHFPVSKIVETHEVCALAGNGAPDCQAAATNACQGKGFHTGQPVDIRTAEKCTASLWVSGQTPAAADCPVETVVLRATCQ
jgi:hypothetical protein